VFSHKIFGGEKDKWLLAFYGYGQSALVYEKLYEKVQRKYNLLVIDNPMHDYSTDLHPNDLKIYLNDLFKKHAIQDFHSMSYSMGSRMNLYLPYFFSEQLKKMFIIAPDGIQYNFWNRVAISTPWGQRIFKFFVENGSAYRKALLFFHKMGVVNKSLYAFSKWHMRDDNSRKRVYNAWMNMRFFRPDLQAVNERIENNNIQLTSYFGKQDPVIPLAIQKKCVRFFPKQKHCILDSDHNLLQNALFVLIAKELNL